MVHRMYAKQVLGSLSIKENFCCGSRTNAFKLWKQLGRKSKGFQPNQKEEGCARKPWQGWKGLALKCKRLKKDMGGYVDRELILTRRSLFSLMFLAVLFMTWVLSAFSYASTPRKRQPDLGSIKKCTNRPHPSHQFVSDHFFADLRVGLSL